MLFNAPSRSPFNLRWLPWGSQALMTKTFIRWSWFAVNRHPKRGRLSFFPWTRYCLVMLGDPWRSWATLHFRLLYNMYTDCLPRSGTEPILVSKTLWPLQMASWMPMKSNPRCWIASLRYLLIVPQLVSWLYPPAFRVITFSVKAVLLFVWAMKV